MLTDTLFEKQHEIIVRSQIIMSEYNGQKSDAEAHLKEEKQAAESTWKREKETAETTWKQEKEAIENNRNSISIQADSVLLSVNQSSQSVQNILGKSRWRDNLTGGTPRLLTISDNSDALKQMEAYQSVTEQISKEVHPLLIGFGWRGRQGVLSGVSGFIVTVVLLVTFSNILTGYLDNGFKIWVYILSCILSGISTAFLLYSLIHTVLSRKALLKLKDAYATILQAQIRVEDLYKQLMDQRDAYQRQVAEGQIRYNRSVQQIDQSYRSRLEECQARYNATIDEVNKKYKDDLNYIKHIAVDFEMPGIEGME